jgi:ABC-type phosphate transport system permease subunit
MDADVPLDPEPTTDSDRRAELMLGALVCLVVALLLGMFAFVVYQAWPSFSHNGLSWFGSGGNVDSQIEAMFNSGASLGKPVYAFHGWPLIWGSILLVGGAVTIAFVCSLFMAVFIVEFAPDPLRRVLEPVVRLLASVPSVIYGLVGVFVLVPFIGNHLISAGSKASVAGILTLNGYGLLAGVLILTVMIAPVMVAVFSDGLRAVPRGWIEASLGLGINKWRTVWKIGVRTARPALVAGTVLATARALGEAVMIGMVCGVVSFAPNPADGWIFFVEPTRPLAATIIAFIDDLSAPPMRHTLYAIAAVLLLSAAFLSFAGWAAKQSMRRYGAHA